jgi:predicted permease
MRTLSQDLRFALRLLAKSPGFAAVAILTLALGIGANAAVFSIVRAVLLAPLPYRAPDRLVAVFSRFPSLGFDKFWVSPPEYLELRDRVHAFADLGAYSTHTVTISGGREPSRGEAVFASASLLSTLGREPILGHLYSPQEDRPHADPVVLLGDGLFHRGFGANPGVLGRRVSIDGVGYTVIGVLPGDLALGAKPADVYLPLALGPLNPAESSRHVLSLIGRLHPGVSVQAAQAEMGSLVTRWSREIPGAHTPSPDEHPLVIRSLLDEEVGQVRPALLLLWLAVSFVLLIACANIANLFLVRARGRQREIAIRTALGAHRGQLLRQLVTESLVLSLLGGALGALLGAWALRGLVLVHPEDLPRLEAVGFGLWELGYVLITSLVIGVCFGLVSGMFATGLGRSESSGGVRLHMGRSVGRQKLQPGLVVVEVALAAMLATGCGLLLRSFWALQQVDPGFDSHGLLSLQTSLPGTGYPEPEQVVAFYQRLIDRLAALPGVESAAAMSGLPPKRELEVVNVDFESLPYDPKGPAHNVDYVQFVTRDYFRTMTIPLVTGRAFTREDSRDSAGVVVINETMAKVFWPGGNPIGQRFRRPGGEFPWVTVVGIARDVKQGGLDRKAGTEFYQLLDQAPRSIGFAPSTLNIVLRAGPGSVALAESVRREVRRLDPALPIDRVRPLQEVLRDSLARPRLVMQLVLLFAALALVLASVGTYGLLAHSVEQRRQEIGVRMALGARIETLLGMVLKEGLRLVAIGLIGGLALSLALGRLLAGLLFNVAPTDPLTFVGVAAVLVGISLFACYLPARRATRIDPMTVLRRD